MTTITRSSSAVRFIQVSLLKGEVTVCYKDGNLYDYFNVSRRAILNLMINQNISLGFWINENLLDYSAEVKCLPWVTV
jgi:hypothetical protein